MIAGNKVCLRAINIDDLPILVEWRNNPSVAKHFYESEPLSFEMQKQWFEGFLNRSGSEKYYIIQTLEERVPLGTISIYCIDWRNRHAEFGRFYLADKQARGQGYGREALKLLLDFCFNHLNLNKIYCDTQADNEAAISLYESLGFHKEGVKRAHIFRAGEYIDLVALSILESEWLK